VIEEVKRRVPIWKKEFYSDGAVEWVGAPGALAGGGAPEGAQA
jgi:molybdopterin synthase catalytic subunit